MKENVKVSKIMNRRVITVPMKMTIEELYRVLREQKLTGVPVVNDNRELVGIVSREDILRSTYRPPNSYTEFDDIYDLFFPGFQEHEEINRKGRMFYWVEEIMTRDVITVTENASIQEVCRLMFENGIHRIPVVREKKVVGIINTEDIFRFIMYNSFV
ncbi:hypothetical protein DRQ09_10045 [candidate division KSB1 bacterium]|nr:MAG: hypothetical protein DRQ09_10045 [candidate division KSB1 bacterium]